ncbi:hypothetical protein GCM10010458_36600 [Microbacterium luteolum]|uniref:Uncharacterized protein n=1 Tax=Microbacterium luteolum TaxID=69367 RepID=A0ABY7XK84_MICLT|nr:hypothetical protein [Microbacterium luteolum]WDM42525.1 hypothetical protein KV395_04230 [Microbacterium luteolum]
MAGHNHVSYEGHPAWGRLDPEEWPREFLDGPRARAKQLQMLEADVEHAVRWVETMQALVDEGLPDEEFTARRMMALKDWEKSRHRDQKTLHYRYDPLKRPKRLIERDIAKAEAETKKALAALGVKFEARQVGVSATLRAAEGTPGRPPARTPSTRPVPRGRRPNPARPPALHPGLATLDRDTRAMYDNLAPDIDIATTPDSELRRVWTERHEGMSADLIETVLDEINGR